VLVGGSTRIRRCQQLVRNFFAGKEPHKGVNRTKSWAVERSAGRGVGRRSEGHPAADVTPLSLAWKRWAEYDTTDSAQYHDSDAQVKRTRQLRTTNRASRFTSCKARQVREGHRSLGTFKLDGFHRHPGTPQIEVILISR